LEYRDVSSTRVIRNVGYLLAGRSLSGLLVFVLGVAVARILGTSDFGRYALAVTVAALLISYQEFGLNSALVREVARRPEAGRSSLRLTLATHAVVLAVVGAVVGTAAAVTGADTLEVVAAGLWAVSGQTFASIGSAYLRGRERMMVDAVLVSSLRLLTVLVSIAALTMGASVTGLFLAIGAANWLAAVCVLSLVWFRFAPPSLAGTTAIRPLLAPALSMFAFAFFMLVTNRIDIVLLTLFRPADEVGTYAAAANVVAQPTMFAGFFAAALLPVLSRQFRQSAILFAASLETAVRASASIAIPASLMLTIMAEPLTVALYGHDFGDAGLSLAVLAWVLPLAFWSLLQMNAALAANRERRLIVVGLVALATNILANLAAIPLAGAVGAAVVTVGTEVVIAVGTCIAARATSFSPRFAASLAKVVLASSMMAVVTLALLYAGAPGLAPLAVVLYLGATLRLRTFAPAELNALREAVGLPGTGREMPRAAG
jgi:O-antigen/teichoic acid export membrane protein